MPVEILELVIRAHVAEEPRTPPRRNNRREDNQGADPALMTTVEQVMEILKRKKER